MSEGAGKTGGFRKAIVDHTLLMLHAQEALEKGPVVGVLVPIGGWGGSHDASALATWSGRGGILAGPSRGGGLSWGGPLVGPALGTGAREMRMGPGSQACARRPEALSFSVNMMSANVQVRRACARFASRWMR